MKNDALKKRPKDCGCQNNVTGKNQALSAHKQHLVLNWGIPERMYARLQRAGRGAVL